MINNRQAGRRRGRGGNGNGNGGAGGQRPQGQRDSGNRIDSRARGNANQLYEKYKNLASDAQRQGDRVNTEYYLQFADHYFRVLSETRNRFEEQNQRRQRDDGFEAQAFTGSFDTGFDGQDDEYGDEGEPIRAGEQAFGDDRADRQNGERHNGEQRGGERQNGDRQNGDRQNGERQNGQANQRRDARPPRDGNRRDDDTQQNGRDPAGQRDAAPRQDARRGDDAPYEGQRESQPRRTMRRDRDERAAEGERPAPVVTPEAPAAEAAMPEAPVAAEVPAIEAPRRRGRPPRQRPAEEAPAAFDASQLPPSLGISAVAPAAADAGGDAPAEEKPRRRRVRAAPTEVTPAG